MSNQFIIIEREQPFLIPVQEWLEEDHLARFVVTDDGCGPENLGKRTHRRVPGRKINDPRPRQMNRSKITNAYRGGGSPIN